jgi:hypothetical protein
MIASSLLLLAVMQAPLPAWESPAGGTPATLPTPVESLTVVRPVKAGVVADTPIVRRPRAIEYSDQYYTRLTIHRYGSYAMLPLFVAEYSLGQNLMNDASPAAWMKPAHGLVAGGVGVLFSVNTITGVWNLWDSREDPAGRTRRILHSVMMLVSDAGFAATGITAPGHHHFFTNYSDYLHRERVHRDLAIGSIALSAIGGGMMWFWKQ